MHFFHWMLVRVHFFNPLVTYFHQLTHLIFLIFHVFFLNYLLTSTNPFNPIIRVSRFNPNSLLKWNINAVIPAQRATEYTFETARSPEALTKIMPLPLCIKTQSWASLRTFRREIFANFFSWNSKSLEM